MRVRIIISSSRACALQYLLMRAQVRICNSRGLVFLFTLLSISTFRARDCSGVMFPSLRFVHNYPIRAHILVRARICAPFIIGRAEKRLGVLPRSDGALPSKRLPSETIAFGWERQLYVRLRQLNLYSRARLLFTYRLKCIICAPYTMFLKSCIYNIIIKSVKKMRSFYFNLQV